MDFHRTLISIKQLTLTSDLNRGLTRITRNRLGLPERVEAGDHSRLEHVYSASGELLRRVSCSYGFVPVLPMSLSATPIPGGALHKEVYDRCGPFEYTDSVLSRVLFPGGYISGGTAYNFVTDWQGNVRQVVDGSTGEPVQETHYYPYGMTFAESAVFELRHIKASCTNPYRFGGKEWVTAHGADLYDFGARGYNYAIGGWDRIDDLCESTMEMSVYAYCGGDPINYRDPDGMLIKGVSENDAAEVVKDIHAMFPGNVFEKFRNLIIQDNNNAKILAPISQDALANAFDGVTLNEDQQALMEIATNTINSKNTHTIEYAEYDGTISSEGTKAFDELLDLPYVIRDATMEMYNGLIPTNLVVGQFGSGATKSFSKRTHSVVVNDTPHPGKQRAVTTGHELFGHGRSSKAGIKRSGQHVEAIRTENLIIRVMGLKLKPNDGSNHDTRQIIEHPEYLPSFR